MSGSTFRRPLAQVLIASAALCVSACAQDADIDLTDSVILSDPLMARALNDPLMVDPDLAYRNEANAALTIRHDHALPPLAANEELANRAREAARVELLEDGPIPELPFPSGENTAGSLAEAETAGAILDAVGAPAGCKAGLTEDLAWSLDLPQTASMMPHGLIWQAAGAKVNGCDLRVIRYLTPVEAQEALQYHYARADRARLRPIYYEAPEGAVIGDGRTEQLVVHVRERSGGMSVVDLVHWTK